MFQVKLPLSIKKSILRILAIFPRSRPDNDIAIDDVDRKVKEAVKANPERLARFVETNSAKIIMIDDIRIVQWSMQTDKDIIAVEFSNIGFDTGRLYIISNNCKGTAKVYAEEFLKNIGYTIIGYTIIKKIPVDDGKGIVYIIPN